MSSDRGHEQELEHLEAKLKAEDLLLDRRSREEMNYEVMHAMERISLGWLLVAFVLGGLVFLGLVLAWAYQIKWGLGVAGINRPVFWGVYIANFVFWIGISHAGTLISAILRAVGAEWRRPITRAAEAMTVFALMVAGMYPLIHMGRTWRFYWMLPAPTQRLIWPNFRSPLMWDMMAILTYLTGSLIFLYLPLIPDLAMARDHSRAKIRRKLFQILALGWRGTEAEWKHLHVAMAIFTFIIIPVAASVHTIVSWDFAMSNVPGWKSTIFGPYFVVGAIYSGVGALGVVLVMVRKFMGFGYYLRKQHLDNIGKIMLTMTFFWTYFWYNGYLTEWYGAERPLDFLREFMTYTGPAAPLFYGMLIANIVIPISLLWSRAGRTTPWTLALAGISINVGMYLERYIIVPVTLSRNRFPFSWGHYVPSPVELLISIGSLSMFILLYVLLSRIVPLISVWEVQEGQMMHVIHRVGRTLVPGVIHWHKAE